MIPRFRSDISLWLLSLNSRDVTTRIYPGLDYRSKEDKSILHRIDLEAIQVRREHLAGEFARVGWAVIRVRSGIPVALWLRQSPALSSRSGNGVLTSSEPTHEAVWQSHCH